MSYTILPPADDTQEATGRYTILPPAEAEPRGALDSLMRGAGLAGRSVAKAGLAIPGMLGDAANAAINLGLRAIGAPTLGMPSQSFGRVVDAVTPTPETATERVLFEDVAPAILGGGVMQAGGRAAAAAPGVAGAVGRALDAGRGMQALGAASGGAASGITRESGGGAGAQLAAGLAGGALPSLAQGLIEGATRGAIRGGEAGRQKYNARLNEFEQVGVDPTAGQAAGTRRMQAIESGLAKAPGGAGVYAQKSGDEAAQMKARIDQIAGNLSPADDATTAGLTIEKGLKGFVSRFKAEQEFLYSKVDSRIPKQSMIGVDNTKAALAQLNADIPDAPELSKWFKNAKIQGIEGALDADTLQTPAAATAASTLPYEAVKKLRTLVGNEIANNNLASTVPRDKWKALYAALSNDMGAAAKAAGPDAEKAFNRANWYTRAGYDRIESVLDRVSGGVTKTAEKVYLAAVNPSEVRDGASTINAVMKSLTPDERKAVTATTIKRMGVANPSAQDAAGDVFSSETFLTNWNRVSDDAKRVLFADATSRRGLDQLAAAASRIRDGSKVFSNPSGTAQAAANYTAGGALSVSLLTGNLGVAASIVAGIAGSNVTSRLLTNKDFVRWVGQATKTPPAALPTQINMLIQQSKKWAPEDQQAAQEFVTQIGSTGQ